MSEGGQSLDPARMPDVASWRKLRAPRARVQRDPETRNVRPSNMGLQPARSSASAPRSPLSRDQLGALGSRLLVSVALVLSLGAPSPAVADAREPTRPSEAVVTWDYEAPDLSDKELNESGKRSLPLELKECGEAIGKVALHAFEYVRGSTRGADGMSARADSAGVAVTFSRVTPARTLGVKVVVEAGDGDWEANESFVVPPLTPKQWSELPAEATWVFERDGIALPRFWKRVVVTCE